MAECDGELRSGRGKFTLVMEMDSTDENEIVRCPSVYIDI